MRNTAYWELDSGKVQTHNTQLEKLNELIYCEENSKDYCLYSHSK